MVGWAFLSFGDSFRNVGFLLLFSCLLFLVLLKMNDSFVLVLSLLLLLSCNRGVLAGLVKHLDSSLRLVCLFDALILLVLFLLRLLFRLRIGDVQLVVVSEFLHY